jgi:hypothetical protein
MTQRRSAARVADRPTAGIGGAEMLTAKRTFAGCAKLTLMSRQAGRSQKKRGMSVDVLLAPKRRFPRQLIFK